MTENVISRIRGVAFDLDDTLLRDDLSISENTLHTLRVLAASGLHIIPASGRAKLSMKPFVDQLDCASLYISCNGAELWDGRTHELLRAETFSTDLGREIARFGRENGCYTQTYEGDAFFYSEESVWAERYAASSLLRGVYVGDLEAYIQEPRSKILMMDSAEKIARLLPEARDRFAGRASVTCSKAWFLEFNPLRATKGIALSEAARLLGFEAENIMAFGDSLNDIPMLEASGWSVTVANGRPELKSLCRDTCPSNQEDGVSVYLRSVFQGVSF